MPLIQPASVWLSDHSVSSVGISAATAKAPICAQAWAAHIATMPRFHVITSSARRLPVGEPLRDPLLDLVAHPTEDGQPVRVVPRRA